MFLRIDRLQIELPQPTKADPNSAAALQELLGGKFGEMSTLNNYFFQSFNFRDKGKLKPFYSLVASITAEEFGHVELVTNGVNLVARGFPFLDREEPASPSSAISCAPTRKNTAAIPLFSTSEVRLKKTHGTFAVRS
jgi:Mn-containing catalase